MVTKKKLIEVALPLELVNKASAREKSIRHGHPSNLHRWWARRPLSAARAVLFAQMVDDPSAHPELFPTVKEQEEERQRLFRIIEEIIQWENTTNENVLQKARDEIWRSWSFACVENSTSPRASELFNPQKLPAFHDPFAGGGSIPLEAQRLGLESYASDLNPVAVLINKAMIEIPPKFVEQMPVNPHARTTAGLKTWRGSQGLSEDVEYYGRWILNEARARMSQFYPEIEITSAMVNDRADLKPYIGRNLPIIAWLWARTVKSPNPAYNNVHVPLVSNFMLSNKKGKEAYVEPILMAEGYRFLVKLGKPNNPLIVSSGTSAGKRSGFRCLMSSTPITYNYIRSEGKAGRVRSRLIAIVADCGRGRIYLSPTAEQEAVAQQVVPSWKPETALSGKCRVNVSNYGLNNFGDLYTPRQLLAMTTFSDLVQEACKKVFVDALACGLADDRLHLREGGKGALGYSEAIGIFLALIVSKTADSNNSLCPWEPVAQCTRQAFGRQALPMLWDYAEANPIQNSSGGLLTNIIVSLRAIESSTSGGKTAGFVYQKDAANQSISKDKVVSTDPPYYDNISYADLSDFFYVWLRHQLNCILPDLFATLEVPKIEELIATPFRHGSKEKAEKYFLDGMIKVMRLLASQPHPAFPVTIYYAFKQSEIDSKKGFSSTGWETFLTAIIQAGFMLTGTWPIRSEMTAALKNKMNYLASSIVLVCRPKPTDASTIARRDFIAELKSELPDSLAHLQRGNIAPVDLAQSAIGPGMRVYTRYQKVIDAEGNALTVHEALSIINQTLDEVLAEQEGDFDADSRWALAWFEQSGFSEGEYGVAEMLSKAKNTSVAGMVEAGILVSKAGKVRLLQPNELPADWDPEKDSRLTAWEMVHHLIRVLEKDGEYAAAGLVARLGAKAEIARELCYRLYTLCERKKRASLALSYNALVQSWPEIMRLAKEGGKRTTQQSQLFEEE